MNRPFGVNFANDTGLLSSSRIDFKQFPLETSQILTNPSKDEEAIRVPS